MNSGVPQTYESPLGDCLATTRRPFMRAGCNSSRVGLVLLGSLSTLIFASSALGATATGRSGSAHHGVAPACKGHHGGGEKTPDVPVPPIEPTPPVEPKPPTEPTPPVEPVPPVGGGNTVVEVTTPIAAAAVPVAAPSTTTAKPLVVPKTTLKQPARKAAKKHPKKQRARAGAKERTFARSALPSKRAAFTG
jgi:hypothetical protein